MPYAAALRLIAGLSGRFNGSRGIEALGITAGTLALALSTVITVLEQSATDVEDAKAREAASGRAIAAQPEAAQTLIGAYGGAPYTYPSDVIIKRPGVHDLTLKDVAWDAKPFKSPIYYGVRVAHWPGAAGFGGMIDFIHSKAIARFDDVVSIEGTMHGAPAPGRARIGDVFRHLEFSHGHNMLMLNGVYRWPRLAIRLVPYAGFGAGGSFPHTEIAFHKDNDRTYEYQYAGPVGQALVGFELRLARLSYFVEYKFTLAAYQAPLTLEDGWLGITDVWRQLRRWLRGEAPAGGVAETRLTSHQLIGGLGVRIEQAPAMAAAP